MTTSGGDLIAITMSVDHWLVIDAALDNASAVFADDHGRSLRELRALGLAALPDWPADAEGVGHGPRPGRTVTLTLTRGQWSTIASVLRREADVITAGADPGSGAAGLHRAIAAFLGSRTGDTGPPPSTPGTL
ncbi:hypothetical protein ACIBKY_37575 [Nonomuraea sp. NPDC050394]|uniref:hypothetical protein n=1 Tax=Nonomuraea sp. NPDC050394 TaxID=3364363 RepID=UPI0037BD2DB8